MRITEDGFVWKTISAKAAELLFNAGEEEVYVLYDDDSEGLVDTPERLKEATERGCPFGIEVGKLPNAISTPDPAEFVKQLIPPLKWVDSEIIPPMEWGDNGKGPVLSYAKVRKTQYEIREYEQRYGAFLERYPVPFETYESVEAAKAGVQANLEEIVFEILKL
ncbi:hypothetical protein [Porphyromonas gulae]|uniref:hypothetical protein n=1 Tax=Porphyromonas gulae TaxID=111105 RepID=UPI000B1329A5|nr:hypothetical protein [Porphyromonas gulae]